MVRIRSTLNVAIHPDGVELPGKVAVGSRGEKILEANSMIKDLAMLAMKTQQVAGCDHGGAAPGHRPSRPTQSEKSIVSSLRFTSEALSQTNTGWFTVVSVVGHAPTPCEATMATT
jgi:hypothetical protein